MGNLFLNIRFFIWHIQWVRNFWRPTISENSYHKDTNWPDGYFSIYQLPDWLTKFKWVRLVLS